MNVTRRRNVLAPRLFALLAALAFLAAAAAALALPAFADEGDLDEILRYDITAAPQQDGSLALTAEIDWKVLDSTSEGPLEWVTIGIPNEKASNAKALTDTISALYVDGTYMHVTFDRSYSAGETVHFAFSWTQSYLYTLGEDGSVSYDYTPGWFENANVDEMSITWKGTGTAPSAASATGAADFAEPADGASGDYVASGQNLAHGQQLHVQFTYPSWPAALSADSSAENYTGETYTGGDFYDSGDSYDTGGGDALLIFVFILIIVVFYVVRMSASWNGGFGGPAYIYVGGLYYPKGPDGHPRPGSVGVKTPPHSGFGGMGGGSSFGGGAGRGGGGCACASSCACACACACAGGGRAGCSAKNLYGAIHLPAAAEPAAPADPQTDAAR